MSQMLKSSGGLAAATMMSRIMGMVREMVYASFMGVGMVAGAFQLAFMIPNLFRRLLGEGALTAAFIPIFKEKEKTSSEAEMWRAANAVISGLVMVASFLSVLVMLGISVALATHEFQEKSGLMLRLLRIMFPYMLLVCLTAVFMGMLNARGHFFIPASGALVMNVVMISSVYFLAPHMGRTLEEQIFAVAIGVLASGVLQAMFQLPWLRGEGFRYHWVTPFGDATVRRVVRQMIPGTIGVAAFQNQYADDVWDCVLGGPGDCGVVCGGGAVDGIAAGGVRGFRWRRICCRRCRGWRRRKSDDEFRATLNQGIDHLVFVNLLATR